MDRTEACSWLKMESEWKKKLRAVCSVVDRECVNLLLIYKVVILIIEK